MHPYKLVEEQLFKTIVLTIVPEMPKQEFFVAPPQREDSFPKHTHTNPTRIYMRRLQTTNTPYITHIVKCSQDRYTIHNTHGKNFLQKWQTTNSSQNKEKRRKYEQKACSHIRVTSPVVMVTSFTTTTLLQSSPVES